MVDHTNLERLFGIYWMIQKFLELKDKFRYLISCSCWRYFEAVYRLLFCLIFDRKRRKRWVLLRRWDFGKDRCCLIGDWPGGFRRGECFGHCFLCRRFEFWSCGGRRIWSWLAKWRRVGKWRRKMANFFEKAKGKIIRQNICKIFSLTFKPFH